MSWNDDGIRNAKIESTDLGFHDGYGSIKNAWVRLDYGGSTQAFGGYALGGWATDAFVYGVLDALECDSWEKLRGQYCRVEIVKGMAVRIGHPLKDKWFDPRTMKERRDGK